MANTLQAYLTCSLPLRGRHSPSIMALILIETWILPHSPGRCHHLSGVGIENETYLSSLEAERRRRGRLKLGREGLRSSKDAKQGEFEKYVSDVIGQMTSDSPL